MSFQRAGPATLSDVKEIEHAIEAFSKEFNGLLGCNAVYRSGKERAVGVDGVLVFKYPGYSKSSTRQLTGSDLDNT